MSKFVALFGRPEFLRAFHGWMTLAWLVIGIPAGYLLRSSVPFVVILSVYAIVTGHWSSWQASRVEVVQNEQIEAAAETGAFGDNNEGARQ